MDHSSFGFYGLFRQINENVDSSNMTRLKFGIEICLFGEQNKMLTMRKNYFFIYSYFAEFRGNKIYVLLKI